MPCPRFFFLSQNIFSSQMRIILLFYSISEYHLGCCFKCSTWSHTYKLSNKRKNCFLDLMSWTSLIQLYGNYKDRLFLSWGNRGCYFSADLDFQIKSVYTYLKWGQVVPWMNPNPVISLRFFRGQQVYIYTVYSMSVKVHSLTFFMLYVNVYLLAYH